MMKKAKKKFGRKDQYSNLHTAQTGNQQAQASN